MVTDPPMRKGLGSDGARIQRPELTSRAMRRPELGALSGVILIYAVFYATARSSGMFSVEGIVNILSVSAEIGIIASRPPCSMIGGEFDLSLGSMIGFAGIIIGLGVTNTDCRSRPATLVALVICGGSAP